MQQIETNSEKNFSPRLTARRKNFIIEITYNKKILGFGPPPVKIFCVRPWDTRNSLELETVKALVQVKVNFDEKCPQMYKMLISNNKLLDQIGGWAKYK